MKKFTKIFGLLDVALMLMPLAAHAKTVVWEQHFPQTLYYYWINDGWQNIDVTPVSGVAAGRYITGLTNYYVQVQYHADVLNCDTGSQVSDGTTVPVGTRLKFTPRPHVDTDIYWFGTGYSIDTPYGNWIEDAGVPKQFCTADDYVESVMTDGDLSDIYIPLNIDPPNEVSVTQKGTAVLGAPDAQGASS